MARIDLYLGPASSQRSAAVDRLFLANPGRALLVVPTRTLARRRIESLAEAAGGAGFWGAPVLEFNDFAGELLRSEGVFPHLADDIERTLLLANGVRTLLAATGGLDAKAADSGVVAHLLRVITQLKQAAIEPADFAKRTGGARSLRPFDVLVAGAYAAYQEAMKEAGAYDVPGLFWEANFLCMEKKPRLLEGIDTLLFDGFDDFTPSQERLIHGVARHVAALAIGLNHDVRPEREDLFALQAKTASSLVEHMNAELHIFEAPEPQAHGPFIAREIFSRNPVVLPEGLAPGVRIVPCTDITHEVETIARAVKTHLIAGVPAEQIAVVYRRIDTVAPTVRAVFREAGIPLRIAGRESLAQSGLGRFAARLLDALQGWEREAVLEVVRSPWPCSLPRAGGDTAAWPAIARAARIIRGHREWLSLLEAMADRAEDGAHTPRGLPRGLPAPAEEARALLENVKALRALAPLPEEATAREHAHALANALDALGVRSYAALRDTQLLRDQKSAPEGNTAALEALDGLLAALARAGGDTRMPAKVFADHLRSGLNAGGYSLSQPAAGVVVCDAPSARNLRFDHVFFAGLNEGEAPLPPAANAIYSDAERRDLAERGIPLEGNREHALRERLLFQHMLEVPRATLTLLWRAQDSSGRQAAPSPFINDVKALLDGVDVEARPPLSDAFVPALEEAVSPRELRNAVFRHGVELAPKLDALCGAALLGAAIEQRRNLPEPFDAYDGVLEFPGPVAARFGEDHCFSANSIEAWLSCPFRFFQEYVLHVVSTATPEPEMPPMVRGLVLHEILQRFHERYRGLPLAALPEGEAEEAMRDFVAEVCRPGRGLLRGVPKGAVAMEAARFNAMLTRYVKIERARDDAAQWAPAHFEVNFGRTPGASSDPLSTNEPFALDTETGKVAFSGRIDRIDVHESGADRLRILDYKSSSPPQVKDINSGTALQVLLYVLAVEGHVKPAAVCASGVYLRPGREKDVREVFMARKKDVRVEREASLREAVARAIQGIRMGHFEPTPGGDACRTCASAKACRHQRARIERKTGVFTEELGESSDE